MARNSWRFNFIDENLSQFEEPEQSVGTLGYMVVRAPKGEQKAMYFPAGAADMIKSLIGIPTAHYPDIQEAIEFNRHYGLYISAPAGNSTMYPSYYGGEYFTKVGPLPFYKVTNKDAPNFEAAIAPGSEKRALSATGSSKISVIVNKTVNVDESSGKYTLASNDQGAIVISDIPVEVFNKMQYVDFNYWGNKEGTVPAGTYRYYIDKDNNLLEVCDANGSPSDLVCGEFKKEGTKYTIIIGGNSVAKNSKADDRAPFLDFNEVVNYLDFYEHSGAANGGYDFVAVTPATEAEKEDLYVEIESGKVAYATLSDEKKATATEFFKRIDSIGNELDSTKLEQLQKYLVEGGILENFSGSTNNNPVTYESATAPVSVSLIYDLSNIVYYYVVQKTPTAYPTVVRVKDVVYDKYIYDTTLPFVVINSKDTPLQMSKDDSGSSTTDCVKESWLNGAEAFIAFTSDKTPVKIYKKVPVRTNSETGEIEEYGWGDATLDYATKKILVGNHLSGEFTGMAQNVPETTIRAIEHLIYKVKEDGKGLDLMKVDHANPDLVLEENIKFNSFTLSCEEEDYSGQIQSGGEWTGSLDEGGEDEFGGQIYWKDVLPNDSATFIELHPIKTFDKDLDEDGWFTQRRLDSKNVFTLSGERYVSKVVDELIKKDKLGGDWDKKFGSIIKAGLVEATQPLYEEVSFFMEPTGNNDMKDYFPAITKAHQMATVIAPLTISQTQFNNVSTIPVAVRGRNIAYTVGEFQFYDKNTRKRYYSGIIGSYGAMLAKIDDEFLGAVAPAWKNDRAVGGELNRDGILSAKWDFSDLDTKVMDKKNINPILLSADNEVMVVSQKTSELDAGDWSYLGHSMSFNKCKREIRDQIMVVQLMKPIDDYWIGKQTEKGEEILGKRLNGSRPAWTAGKIKCKELNTPATKAKRMFMIQAIVKVTPFSEGVTLVFTNIGQDMNIEDL